MLTNEEIERYIKIEKELPKGKFKTNKTDRYYECDIQLNCDAINNVKFNVFIRQHIEMDHNFSIGLSIKLQNKGTERRFNLYRFNGAKSQHMTAHHRFPHIHILTEEDIILNRENKPSNIKILNENISFNNAILYFVREINIINAENYFEFLIMDELFNDEQN